jgi:hypothetical protein
VLTSQRSVLWGFHWPSLRPDRPLIIAQPAVVHLVQRHNRTKCTTLAFFSPSKWTITIWLAGRGDHNPRDVGSVDSHFSARYGDISAIFGIYKHTHIHSMSLMVTKICTVGLWNTRAGIGVSKVRLEVRSPRNQKFELNQRAEITLT